MQGLMMMSTAAYRPFLDPMDLHDSWWITLFPLLFLMSMAYKACRVGDLRVYWRQVVIMTAQLVVLMVVVAASVHAIVEWVIPALEKM